MSDELNTLTAINENLMNSWEDLSTELRGIKLVLEDIREELQNNPPDNVYTVTADPKELGESIMYKLVKWIRKNKERFTCGKQK